jgi:Domain of unknown function (DUF6484)
MKSKAAGVTVIRDQDVARALTAARTGLVTAMDPDGTVYVTPSGSKEAHRARVAVSTSIERLEEAMRTAREVVLLFEGGDPMRPIIIGFIELPERETRHRVIEADVDGKRVRVVGKDEIVLQCGSASVTLRRNGRVVIRGTHVETHSDGTNRIKGGHVRIN